MMSPLPNDPWSIGIYKGSDPFHLCAPPDSIINPVLTCDDITDIPAAFVADPFLLRRNGNWHLFFEVLNQETQRGEIGLAVSADGFQWKYQQIVLRESGHLSYPCVFSYGHEIYMVPETLDSGAVRLYRANSFPLKWNHIQDLIPRVLADPSLFYFNSRWWLFACPRPSHHDTLCLYHSPGLFGPWSEHPLSPLIQGNASIARPGGRVLIWNNSLYRFTQDCLPCYGSQLRVFAITQLTPTEYSERECAASPIFGATGFGWNGRGMHHIDVQPDGKGNWLAAVDGHQLAKVALIT